MAKSESLNLSSEIEESSKKCYVMLNNLANLCLDAVYVFGFITDILEQEPPLQNVLEAFRTKSIHARTSAQVLIGQYELIPQQPLNNLKVLVDKMCTY